MIIIIIEKKKKKEFITQFGCDVKINQGNITLFPIYTQTEI